MIKDDEEQLLIKEWNKPTIFIPGRPTTDSTTAAYEVYDQGATGNSWGHASAEAAAYLQAVAMVAAALEEAALREQEAQKCDYCLPAVPTLQLLQQRRYDRAEGHRLYLQQVTKAKQHAQRKPKPKIPRVNRRKLRG